MRRWFLAALCALLSLGAGAQPRHTVSQAALQEAVARKFPVRQGVAGLLQVEVLAPALRLLPAENRIGAELPLTASGPALARSYTGAVDLDFALRYEAADRTIRAHMLRVNALRLPDAPPRTAEALQSLVPALAREALVEVVLHRLRPQDLALADTMGLQPDSITVTAEGLVVAFAAKPAS